MTWRLLSHFRVLFIVLALIGIWLLTVAATGDAASIANALAAAAVVLSPLALKFVHVDGKTMLAISYAASVLIAAAALVLSGEASLDFSSAGSILAFATALFGLQQIVFSALNQQPSTEPLVK